LCCGCTGRTTEQDEESDIGSGVDADEESHISDGGLSGVTEGGDLSGGAEGEGGGLSGVTEGGGLSEASDIFSSFDDKAPTQIVEVNGNPVKITKKSWLSGINNIYIIFMCAY